MLRALITGYSGFAGSHLADHLLTTTDWDLWGTVFDADRARVRHVDGVRELPVDLRDPAAVAAAVETSAPDVVFHLAGQASVKDAWSDPWATFESNVRMQVNLHQALVGWASPVRLVVVTSNEVYGAPPPESLPTDESAPLAPLNPYAVSKVAQDMLADMYGRSGPTDIIRVRPFAHIGPNQDDRFVAASFARQVAEIEAGVRPPVVRVGNLSAERDFTDVRDTVRGYRLAAQRGRPGEAYNLGSGECHPIREILDTFIALAHVAVEVVPDPDRMRPADVQRMLCDAGRARAELGWEPRIPFAQTLAEILDEWRARVGAPAAKGS